ncbi:MAG TPA: DUF4037 domain-containing protein [Thermomicrobiaceae bacterium]|nr:DUF4037 domain-containing protein [Thermomicrobiaceae bacterium]
MSDEQPATGPLGPNLAEAYRDRARQLARRFAVLEGVVGVALVGGLPLGQADRYSDLDLVVYLRHRTLQTWLLGGAPLPEGVSRSQGIRLDLSYRDYAEDQTRDWSPTERWQATTAEVLYDPEGLVNALFTEKGAYPEAERDRALARELAAAERLLASVAPAWLYRGDALAAHHALGAALDAVLAVVYLINERPFPGQLWGLRLSRDLPWLPDRWEERLAAALVVAEPSNAEASRRRQVLSGLLRDCWVRMAPRAAAEVPPSEAGQLQMLRELATLGELPLDAFRERYELRALIQSPAFDLLAVRRREAGAMVVFRRERLAEIVEHELGRYLDGQQRVLRQLATGDRSRS